MPKNPREIPLSVSQNFLTSAPLIRSLIARADLRPGEPVYEIGPGKGHITRQLLAAGLSVRAIELDEGLAAKLKTRFAGENRLSLRQGDFLRTALPKAGDYTVFSNIPFSRTTAILRKLTGAPNPPRAAWLIVEEGAAKRFCAAFGKREKQSLLSLSLRPFFELRVLCSIPPSAFHPAPSCRCALLCVRRKDRPDLPLSQRESFRRFLENARRGGLRALLTKRQIAAALKKANLPPVGKDENLLYVQWLCLFRCWRNCHL